MDKCYLYVILFLLGIIIYYFFFNENNLVEGFTDDNNTIILQAVLDEGVIGNDGNIFESGDLSLTEIDNYYVRVPKEIKGNTRQWSPLTGGPDYGSRVFLSVGGCDQSAGRSNKNPEGALIDDLNACTEKETCSGFWMFDKSHKVGYKSNNSTTEFILC